MNLEDAQRLDAADPLRSLREFFQLPDGITYLDGNSLGALPKATPERIQSAVTQEWGQGLIKSWNTAGWIDLPRRLGDRLAPWLGARPGEVLVADSTSVNLYKVLHAALQLQQATQAADHTQQVAQAEGRERVSGAQASTATIVGLGGQQSPDLLLRLYRERIPAILSHAGSVTTVDPGDAGRMILEGPKP